MRLGRSGLAIHHLCAQVRASHSSFQCHAAEHSSQAGRHMLCTGLGLPHVTELPCDPMFQSAMQHATHTMCLLLALTRQSYLPIATRSAPPSLIVSAADSPLNPPAAMNGPCHTCMHAAQTLMESPHMVAARPHAPTLLRCFACDLLYQQCISHTLRNGSSVPSASGFSVPPV